MILFEVLHAGTQAEQLVRSLPNLWVHVSIAWEANLRDFCSSGTAYFMLDVFLDMFRN